MAESSQARIWGGSIGACHVGHAMRSVGAPVRLERQGSKNNRSGCDTVPCVQEEKHAVFVIFTLLVGRSQGPR